MNEKIKKIGIHIRDYWSWTNLFWGRGRALVGVFVDSYDMFIKIGMGGFLIDWMFDIGVPKKTLIFASILGPITLIILAYIDKRWIHLWQLENERATKLNPFMLGINIWLENINTKVDKLLIKLDELLNNIK